MEFLYVGAIIELNIINIFYDNIHHGIYLTTLSLHMFIFPHRHITPHSLKPSVSGAQRGLQVWCGPISARQGVRITHTQD